MHQLAVIIDGVWQTPQTVSNGERALTPTTAIDEVVSSLARVVLLAQSLDVADQRRVRDFVRACSATLDATTYLPHGDQKTFENALRNVAAKR
jgi:predicted glycosyltransferase involved in capsule biosynthesis